MRDFSPAFEVVWSLGFSCGFNLTSVHWQPPDLCSQGLWDSSRLRSSLMQWLAHRNPLQWELTEAGPGSRESISVAALYAFRKPAGLLPGTWRKGLKTKPFPSSHAPFNKDGLLLWWTWTSSRNTPGCSLTTFQSLQAISMQPTSVFSQACPLNPELLVSVPSPCPHQWTHVSDWHMQGGGTVHLCKSLFVLPAANQLLCSSLSLWSSLLVLPDHTSRLPRVRKYFLFSSFQGHRPCFAFSLSLFVFTPWVRSSYMEIFWSVQIFEVFH